MVKISEKYKIQNQNIDWKGDAIKCFDCGEYSLLETGGKKCLYCDSENITWIDSDEPEMNEDRFIDKCGWLRG